MSNYYEIKDDNETCADRWMLSDPVDLLGNEVDTFLLTEGQTYEGPAPVAVSVRREGRRVPFVLFYSDLPFVDGKVLQILESVASGDFEAYPVSVVGRSERMFIINVIRRCACMDESRALFEKVTENSPRPDLAGDYSGVYRLRIDPAKVEGLNMFRVEGWTVTVVVSQRVKEALEGIPNLGVRFEMVGGPDCHDNDIWSELKSGARARKNEFFDAKKAAMEKVLGPMDPAVWHSIVPFDSGGQVDLYSFSGGMPGTAFATMELIRSEGAVAKANQFGSFELVAFTRLRPMEGAGESPDEASASPFDKQVGRVWGMLDAMAKCSRREVLSPGETAELPSDEGTRYVILDRFNTRDIGFAFGSDPHHLLVCMEVFPSELAYARREGAASLIAKLKAAGAYPYSDLNRAPVA